MYGFIEVYIVVIASSVAAIIFHDRASIYVTEINGSDNKVLLGGIRENQSNVNNNFYGSINSLPIN